MSARKRGEGRKKNGRSGRGPRSKSTRLRRRRSGRSKKRDTRRPKYVHVGIYSLAVVSR